MSFCFFLLTIVFLFHADVTASYIVLDGSDKDTGNKGLLTEMNEPDTAEHPGSSLKSYIIPVATGLEDAIEVAPAIQTTHKEVLEG